MEKDNKASMQESKGFIRELRGKLNDNLVYKVISSLWELNDMYTNYKLQERLTAIDNDYKMIKKYWLERVVDERREEMYNKIVGDLDSLLCDMEMERMKCNMAFFMDCRRTIAQSGIDFTLTEVKARLEAYVSDFAMTELLPEKQKAEKLNQLHAKHQQYLDLMFNYILCIGSMSKLEAEGWTDIMTSPTIDAADRHLLMAALVINMQSVPQKSKMRCLLDIYEQAEDDHVRQPALVGWALSLHFKELAIDKEMEQEIKAIMNTPANTKELLSLQLQILISMNAEHDSHMMDMELNKVRLTSEYRKIADGLNNNDVDHSLDDVLNAGENNAQMDEWIESLSKISDMRKRGADIFFGSFSQIKNYGFFSKPANWFVNFYLEHPDISSTYKLHPSMFSFMHFFCQLPMLPADKYSFVLVTANMIKRLPPELLKQTFDDFPTEFPEIPEGEAKSMEIRDGITKMLYRFYKLFSHRECFENPMDLNSLEYGNRAYLFMANRICQDTLLLSNLVPFLKTLYKMGHKREIKYIVNMWMTSSSFQSGNDFDFAYFWGAYCHEMYNMETSLKIRFDMDEAIEAIKYLKMAHAMRPEMHSITKRLLEGFFSQSCFDKVIAMAEELDVNNSTDGNLLSKYAIALYKENKLDEAEKVFYKVIYLSPNESQAISKMPELLIARKKFDQAEKLVNGWMSNSEIVSNNSDLYKWMALFCYRRGELDSAAENLARYISHIKDFRIEALIDIEEQLFESLDPAVNEIDKRLFASCVYDHWEALWTKTNLEERS